MLEGSTLLQTTIIGLQIVKRALCNFVDPLASPRFATRQCTLASRTEQDSCGENVSVLALIVVRSQDHR